MTIFIVNNKFIFLVRLRYCYKISRHQCYTICVYEKCRKYKRNL